MANLTKKQLEQEVSRLKRELREQKSAQKAGRINFKNIFKWFCFALACALIVVANLSFYSARTLVEEQKFNQVSRELIKQPAVQKAVAAETTKAIFANVDVQQYLTEVLPPRADILAPTLAGQLEKFTLEQSEAILANPTFQENAVIIINQAHSTFINTVRDYRGDGTINVNDLYAALSEQLQSTKLAALANRELPPNIGEVQVFEADWLPLAHNFVVKLDWLRAATAVIFFGLMGLFIWLSSNRRRALVQIGIALALLALATILALNVSRGIAVESAVNYPEAVGEIWDVLAGPLIAQTAGVAVFGAGLALVAWLGGNTKNARKLRSKINQLLSGRLHQAFFSKENGLTRWFGRYRKALQLLIALGFLLALAMVSVTLSSIISCVVVFGILSLTVEILAATKR